MTEGAFRQETTHHVVSERGGLAAEVCPTLKIRTRVVRVSLKLPRRESPLHSSAKVIVFEARDVIIRISFVIAE